MRSKLQELIDEFDVSHPELAGPGKEGVITPEQASDLTQIFDTKIRNISRKDTLAENERAFLNHSLDMSARCLIYWLERLDMDLPHNQSAQSALNRLRGAMQGYHPLAGEREPVVFSADEIKADKALFIRMLGSLIGGGMHVDKIRQTNRQSVEHSTRNILGLITELARESPQGLPVDRYLSGNLMNMLAHYELTEAQE